MNGAFVVHGFVALPFSIAPKVEALAHAVHAPVSARQTQ
jgi:hypothetical protein